MARVALVTGGTRGIGAEISRALKAQARTVVAIYAGNDEAARHFQQETGIRTWKCDVGDFDACKQTVEQITAEIGPVEVLVTALLARSQSDRAGLCQAQDPAAQNRPAHDRGHLA